MTNSAHNKVDPKLADLIGETYRSLEKATKGLIDNSFDSSIEPIRNSYNV